jgi:hypothetical protein
MRFFSDLAKATPTHLPMADQTFAVHGTMDTIPMNSKPFS